tara:strand:+ start:2068 stop:2295 length:228 start_codon:yes stop_codon:yes gene_type:complete
MLSQLMEEISNSDFALDLKESILSELQTEIKTVASQLVTEYIDEIKDQLIETASQRMIDIIHNSLMDALKERSSE